MKHQLSGFPLSNERLRRIQQPSFHKKSRKSSISIGAPQSLSCCLNRGPSTQLPGKLQIPSAQRRPSRSSSVGQIPSINYLRYLTCRQHAKLSPTILTP